MKSNDNQNPRVPKDHVQDLVNVLQANEAEILNSIRRRLKTRKDVVEDALADVTTDLLEMLKTRPDWTPPDKWKPYLYKCVIRRTWRILGGVKLRREVAFGISEDDPNGERPSKVPDPLDSCVKREEAGVLQEAIQSLTERERELVGLRFAGLSAKETGFVLGLTSESAQVGFARAKKRLMTRLNSAA